VRFSCAASPVAASIASAIIIHPWNFCTSTVLLEFLTKSSHNVLLIITGHEKYNVLKLDVCNFFSSNLFLGSFSLSKAGALY
jgi:hypothetical protein